MLPFWLKDTRINNWVLVASSIWRYMGQNMVLFIGAIASVDKTQYEAAAIDGCGIYGCFFRIALPLCRTGFFVSGLMTFINNWNELLLAMVFISDPMKRHCRLH